MACACERERTCAEPERPGSFAAVSTFDTEIEIWELGVIDALQPVASLGGHSGDVPGKKKNPTHPKPFQLFLPAPTQYLLYLPTLHCACSALLLL